MYSLPKSMLKTSLLRLLRSFFVKLPLVGKAKAADKSSAREREKRETLLCTSGGSFRLLRLRTRCLNTLHKEAPEKKASIITVHQIDFTKRRPKQHSRGKRLNILVTISFCILSVFSMYLNVAQEGGFERIKNETLSNILSLPFVVHFFGKKGTRHDGRPTSLLLMTVASSASQP